MRGLPSILSLLRNEFNRLNNTGALNVKFLSKILKIAFLAIFDVNILPSFTQRHNGRHNNTLLHVNM